MKGTTHLAAGVLATALIPEMAVPAAAGVILGSILPDIDKSTSMIGHRVPILPWLLKHRGVTHSILFAAVAYAVYPYIGLGCGIHLILDFINPMGVPLLWPLPRMQRIPVIKSGGYVDRALGWCLWACVAFVYGSFLSAGIEPI